jgi:hypothetical protein
MNVWHEKVNVPLDQFYKIINSTKESGFPSHWHKKIEINFAISLSDIHSYYPAPPKNYTDEIIAEMPVKPDLIVSEILIEFLMGCTPSEYRYKCSN